MKPFTSPNYLDTLNKHYPIAKDIINAARGCGLTRKLIAAQWLSEGIPFAFKEQPWLFEVTREWLSNNLNVHIKNINIVGSARIGESLSGRKLGDRFNANSDFDFFVVSEELFGILSNDFRKWVEDLDNNNISPKNSKEAEYWSNNKLNVSKNINLGFIDPRFIPNIPNRYPGVHKVLNTMSILHRKLKATDCAPKFSDKPTTIRCYRNWNDFTNRISLNLFHAGSIG